MGNVYLNVEYVTETCCHKDCRIQFAFPRDVYEAFRQSREWWYCPHGHSQHYTGTSDAEKLRQAQARESALKDQLDATARDAEATRVALLRDRSRFANGICPCCNRSFENVRRHMASKHPEYPAKLATGPAEFKCSCGRKFETLRGLRVHQGWSRGEKWADPATPKWYAHLTRV